MLSLAVRSDGLEGSTHQVTDDCTDCLGGNKGDDEDSCCFG